MSSKQQHQDLLGQSPLKRDTRSWLVSMWCYCYTAWLYCMCHRMLLAKYPDLGSTFVEVCMYVRMYTLPYAVLRCPMLCWLAYDSFSYGLSYVAPCYSTFAVCLGEHCPCGLTKTSLLHSSRKYRVHRLKIAMAFKMRGESIC